MNRALRFSAAAILAMSGLALTSGRARAQNDSAVPAQDPSRPSSSAPASQTSDKKVWTNDDFSSHPHGNTSPSPNSNTKPASTVNRPGPNTGGKNAAWYRSQISKLQGQIPPLDEKISQLQAALNGQTTNAPRSYSWSKPDDWRAQLAQFQKQRDDIQTKISALQDQARHNGVAENEIP